LNREELTTRQLQALETRNRLFNCAHKLLRQKEYKDITIREIVTAAGVSIGTFYLYFPSKLDVYYQTFVIADDYFENVVKHNLTQPTANERILAFFDHYAGYNANEAGIRLAKLLYNSDNPYFNRNNDFGIVSVLTRLIADGIQSGELKTASDAKTISRYMMIAARGVVYDWCATNGNYDLKTDMRTYMSFLIRAIC
jgi:AcrR family transcriptional regulator